MTPERMKEIEDAVPLRFFSPTATEMATELLNEIDRLNAELDRQGKQASALVERLNVKIFTLVKEMRTLRSYTNQVWITDLVNDTLKKVGEE